MNVVVATNPDIAFVAVSGPLMAKHETSNDRPIGLPNIQFETAHYDSRFRRANIVATFSSSLSRRLHNHVHSSLKATHDKAMNDIPKEDIPLIFLHGMKGSHLSTKIEVDGSSDKIQRSWLSLGGLLNFPPKADDHRERDISLPLSYTNNTKSFPRQDRGRHFVDGTVDHVIQLGDMIPGDTTKNTGNLDFFPFYGHTTAFLENINTAYEKNISDDLVHEQEESSHAFKSKMRMPARPTRSFCYDWRRNLFELVDEFYNFCEKEFPGKEVQVLAHSMGGLITYAAMKKHPLKFSPGGVLVGVPFGTGMQYFQDVHKGYFTELGTCRQFLPPAQFSFSSHWSFFPIDPKEIGDSFVDVSEYFQGDVSNSVGVVFEADKSTIGKKSSKLSAKTGEEEWRPPTPGTPIQIDFYDPDEWERNEIGIFDPLYRSTISAGQIEDYKEHMKLQMDDAKRWRTTIMAPWEDEEAAKSHLMPPLTVCSTISVPTPNQILRRKRLDPSVSSKATSHGYKFFSRSLISLFEDASEKQRKINFSRNRGDSLKAFPRSLISLLDNAIERKSTMSPPHQHRCQWEYDYASGRTVPGDGRVDYDKSFPPKGTIYKKVDLASIHAKQFCWEDKGGNLATILDEVNEQIEKYHRINDENSYEDPKSTERLSVSNTKECLQQ